MAVTDHPTQRLPPAEETSTELLPPLEDRTEPLVRTCLRCGHLLRLMEASATVSIGVLRLPTRHYAFQVRAPDGLLKAQYHWVPCETLVCTRCGYTELYTPGAVLMESQ